MKMKEAKAALANIGMTINRTGYGNEVRVTFMQHVDGYKTAARREAVAYYTDDLNDAVSTAFDMHKRNSDK